MNIRACVILCFVASLCAPTAPVRAAIDHGIITSGYVLSPGTIDQGTFGWSFTPEIDIWVTELGVFDHHRDGLRRSYDVGIWGDTGLVVTTPSQWQPEQAVLKGEYRYVSVPVAKLYAGQTYVIAMYEAFSWPDDFFPKHGS